ncbi:hypothetical protein F5Y07DRAFT_402125 [Xylaria sp. FL0933]|nr:hypothetical protein F5Y07DRAFT_402125 [Xylaria sp. FL0933]
MPKKPKAITEPTAFSPAYKRKLRAVTLAGCAASFALAALRRRVPMSSMAAIDRVIQVPVVHNAVLIDLMYIVCTLQIF